MADRVVRSDIASDIAWCARMFHPDSRVGGNHRLVRSMLSATPDRLTICPQTRVSNIDYHAPADQRSKENGTWKLSGVNGSAAFHDTAEKVAANALPDELGTFDAVLVTDPSASFGYAMHRG